MTRYYRKGLVAALLILIGVVICPLALAKPPRPFFDIPAQDAKPPRVVSTKPASAATGVKVNSNITVTFSRTMDPRTLTDQTITLRRTGDPAVVPGRVLVTDRWFLKKTTATFIPQDPLDLGGSYTATVSKEVKDLSGKRMGANYDWAFTTERLELGALDEGLPPAPQAEADRRGPVEFGPSDLARDVPGSAPMDLAFSWRQREVLSSDPRSIGSHPTVVSDAQGSFMAFWCEKRWNNTTTPSSYEVEMVSRRYLSNGGWQPRVTVWEGEVECSYPSVAMNEAGRGLIVWQRFFGGRRGHMSSQLVSKFYTREEGWEDLQVIEVRGPSESPLHGVEIKMDEIGNAMLIWHRDDAYYYSSWYSHASREWFPYVRTNIPYDDRSWGSPHIALRSSGEALAVWSQLERRGDASLRASFYNSGSGWGPVETLAAESGEHPRVVMDRLGNALVVWDRYGFRTVWTKRYTAGVGWGDPEELGAPGHSTKSGQPNVVMNTNGEAIVAWTRALKDEDSGIAQLQILSKRFNPDSGWGNTELLKKVTERFTPRGTSADYTHFGGSMLPYDSPALAINSRGQILVIAGGQYETTLPHSVPRIFQWAFSYLPGTGWVTTAERSGRGGWDFFYDWNSSTRVAMDSAGRAVAVWLYQYQYSSGNIHYGDTYVHANRYE